MIEECNAFLKSYFRTLAAPVRLVLEAGGGSVSHFHVPESACLVALDISLGQLLRNRSTHRRIQGDLRTLPIRPERFEMIVCFNVLEHVNEPEEALCQLVRALRVNGILLLGFPTRNSLKGLITRLSPLMFRRWYYRAVVGKKDRGEGHFDVFPTVFKPILAERPVREWLVSRGMELRFIRVYDGAAEYGITTGNWKTRVVSIPYYALAWLGMMLTFGAWNATACDILLVAQKTRC